MNPDIVMLESLVSKDKTPSVQYAVFDENRILYEFRKGSANLHDGHPVQDDSIFPVFSITKTFTALAVLQLVEKGSFKLDTPVVQILTDIPLGKTVTVKHLLTHTAGISNPFPLNWIHTSKEHSSFNRNEFFKQVILKSIRDRQPGAKFSYSNLGYVLLGRIIEAVSGSPYEAHVSSRVLNKLQRSDAILTFEPDGLPVTTGYHRSSGLTMMLLRMLMDTRKYMDNSYKNWKPFVPFYINGTPYGGLFANRNGMVVYGQELLKEQSVLISGEYRKLLFTENHTNHGKPTGMCLAWFKGRLKGITYFCHAGGGGGFYCELRLYPELRKGSFIILNRSGFSDKRMLSRIDNPLSFNYP